jgi:hypothetical protein
MIRRLAVTAACLVLAACASTGEKVKLPQAPKPGEPGGIVGLSPATMRGNFGAPSFVRKEGTMELWRYDGRTCKAFFFLYPESTGPAVRHVETLPRGRETAADPDCLNALLASHRGRAPIS